MTLKRLVSLVFILVVTATSAATTYDSIAEYTAGSGSNQATIAIDFDFNNYFLFNYKWDGSATGWDALSAIESAGTLEITSTHYSWGELITDFAYLGGIKYAYSPDDSTGWAYYGSSDNQNWAGHVVGCTDRYLNDGDWDSWVWTNYAPDWGPPYRTPGGEPIPEPGTIVLLTIGSLLLRGRYKQA